MKFSIEFKNAISLLSSKEKDKLILRLLKRDKDLANQLNFQLISDETVLERRHKTEARVEQEITRMTNLFNSSGYLLLNVKNLSSEITEHVKTTKDKYGEVSLNLLMLNKLLRKNNNRIAQTKLKDSYKLTIYIIVRTFRILILIKSLHEDYLIEFEDGLKELGQLITQNAGLMDTAIKNGFDVNWLTQAEIPNDIVLIHKKIRSMGFLKITNPT